MPDRHRQQASAPGLRIRDRMRATWDRMDADAERQGAALKQQTCRTVARAKSECRDVRHG